ncbi:unnamed protein product [Malus baccata var. baccata]
MSLLRSLSRCFHGETKLSRSGRPEDGLEAWNVAAAAKHLHISTKSSQHQTLFPLFLASTDLFRAPILIKTMSKNMASWFMSFLRSLSGFFHGETKGSRSGRPGDGPEAWNLAAAKHFSNKVTIGYTKSSTKTRLFFPLFPAPSDPTRAPILVPDLRISTIAASHSHTAPSSPCSSSEMAKASTGHHDEFEDDDEVSHGGELAVKVEGQGREKNRSKHSETEQRRRSKINERQALQAQSFTLSNSSTPLIVLCRSWFYIVRFSVLLELEKFLIRMPIVTMYQPGKMLKDIIPQNDQKRDKASLLLEEKVNLYEGSYQGWSPEPTKLVPWKNHNRSGENLADQSQVMNNGSGHENNVVVSPAMLPNTQNSLDHIAGLATQLVPNVQQQSILDSIGSGVPTQPLQESIIDVRNMASRPQFPSLAGITSSAVSDGKLNKQDEHSGSGSISSAYSQGVLNNLTQALQSAGLDLSLASISVQMDVGNRASSGLTSVASSSKARVNRSMNNQMMTQAQVSSCDGGFEPAHKRFRTRDG